MKTTQTEFLKAAFRSGLLLTTLLVVVAGVSLAEPSRGGLTAQEEARIAADAHLNKAGPQTTVAVQPEEPLLALSSPGGHLTHRVPVQANMALIGQEIYLDLLTIPFLTVRNEPIARGPVPALDKDNDR